MRTERDLHNKLTEEMWTFLYKAEGICRELEDLSKNSWIVEVTIKEKSTPILIASQKPLEARG